MVPIWYHGKGGAYCSEKNAYTRIYTKKVTYLRVVEVATSCFRLRTSANRSLFEWLGCLSVLWSLPLRVSIHTIQLRDKSRS